MNLFLKRKVTFQNHNIKQHKMKQTVNIPTNLLSASLVGTEMAHTSARSGPQILRATRCCQRHLIIHYISGKPS